MKLYAIAICVVYFILFDFLGQFTVPHMLRENLVLGLHSLSYPLSFINNNFMHGGILHLVLNMVFVYQFGSLIDNIYNKKEQLFLYFGSGLIIALIIFAYVTAIGQVNPIVGYSGIACCLMGATFKYLPQETKNSLLLQMGIFHIAIILLGLPISWESHLVGAIIGYLYSNNRFIANINFNKATKKKKYNKNLRRIK